MLMIALAVGALLLVSSAPCEAQTVQEAIHEELSPVVEWNAAVSGDRLIGEVTIDGVVVMRLREPMGGMSVLDRARVVAIRLSEALDRGLDPASIGTGQRSSGPSVELEERHLVIVGQRTAKANDTTPEDLARVWANQIRVQLGADPLPEILEVTASWYGPGFHGRRTASGEVFDSNSLTAAHKELPFGTLVRVMTTDLRREIMVRINDRGPFVEGRDIDLSHRAARELGIAGAGVSPVLIEIID